MDAPVNAAPLTREQQRVLDRLLLEAAEARDLAHVQLYVQKGADVNMSAGTVSTSYPRNGSGYSFSREAPLFHFLYAHGFPRDIAGFLIEQGVDVDARDALGNTVLMVAVKQGDADAAAWLVAKGADPLAVNNAREIVLDEARALSGYYHSDRQRLIDTLVGALPDANAAPQNTAQNTVIAEASPPEKTAETPLQKRIQKRFNP